MIKAMRLGMLALAWVAGEAWAQFCPGLSPWVFTDVASSHPFCTDITWMAERGVTLGCVVLSPTTRLYCPNGSVNRGEMAAFMHRLGEELFPSTCAAGQVMKWNGLAWACANDALGGSGGGGTVTSVAAGTGLTGTPNPIVGAGTISVAASYRLPQACAANQVAKWNGSAWTCAADVAGAGTLTSLSAGAGIALTPNPIVATGTVAADTSYLQRRVSGTCAAGSSIRTINADGTVMCEVDDAGPTNAFVQGGNAFGTTAVLGSNDAQAVEIEAGNARVMRYEPNAISPNVIGGSPANSVTAGVRGATIAGGGVPAGDTDPIFTLEAPNRVTDAHGTVGGGYANRAGDDSGFTTNAAFATVAGGRNNSASGGGSTVAGGTSNMASWEGSTVAGGAGNTASGGWSIVAGGAGNTASGSVSTVAGGGGNTASGSFSAVAGGDENTTSGTHSTVAGGFTNMASGSYSAVAGGILNTASGVASTVAGGDSNTASGTFSFAAGRRANAQLTGCHVWSDGSSPNFTSCNGPNEFIARAVGGFYFFTAGNSDATYTGASLPSGAGAWGAYSDRAGKRDFEPVDPAEVLAKVVALPISTWEWKAEATGIRHMGPTAQDFRAAFGLGRRETEIVTVDADGVALAAIQGLHQLLREKETRIETLEKALDELKRSIDALPVVRR